jgi:hypothetical protein
MKYYVHLAIVGAGLVTWIVNLVQLNHSGAAAFFGDDTFAHLQLVGGLATGDLHLGLGHPFLFQETVLQVSRLAGTDPIATYTQLAMLSYPLMVLAIGYAAYALFGRQSIGALAAFCLAFVSIQPLQSYQDGTIPNIVGIGVLFPLFLIGLTLLRKSKAWWPGSLVCFAAVVALFLTHHLSTLIALSSLALAGVLSMAWLAFCAPKGSRRLFVVPLLVALGVIALVVFVIRPTAVISLVSLYLAFDWHYPWIHVANTVGYRIPWNVLRYGQDLGGIVFQLGVVGIALVWYEIRTAKLYREAFPALVLTAWALIYWLGSMTAVSGEPDRLARDFALPGSILAAYVLCWCVDHFKDRQRPLLAAILLVTLVSSLFTGYHRYKLATNVPGYLFGSIDQEVYDADVAYGTALGVYSPNYYWVAAAEARGMAVSSLNSADEVRHFLSSGGICVLQFAYKQSIAGGDIDPRFAEPVIGEGTYRVERLEDAKKVIWRFCNESAIPVASTSQNT